MPQRHRPDPSESVAGEPLAGHLRTRRTFRADRVCEAPGCSTRLSIYNTDTVCSAHSGHRLRASREPRASEVTAAS